MQGSKWIRKPPSIRGAERCARISDILLLFLFRPTADKQRLRVAAPSLQRRQKYSEGISNNKLARA